jgi:UDP-GlcNAc:undecaprenyl-phosphate GlcNAc-1-phosphate transferase
MTVAFEAVERSAWFAAAGAAVLMVAFTPIVMRAAWRAGWVATPRADRWHQKPTALMGGIAIFAAATLAAALSPAVGDGRALVIWLAGTAIFALGCFDDRRVVLPQTKLLVELLATGAVLASRIRIGPDWPWWLSAPVTALWVVGITNAVNLLDNMDGLAAGVTAIAATAIGALLAVSGQTPAAAAAFAIAGACAGFLLFNFSPARVFMGDCGSLFLGFTLAVLALDAHVVQYVSGRGVAAYLTPLLACAVFVADTTLVTVARIRAGRPVSQGGRDHSSHRLVFAGLTERGAVLVLYGVAALGGVVALASRVLSPASFAVLAVALLAAIATLFGYLLRQRVYGPAAVTTTLPRRPAPVAVTRPAALTGGFRLDRQRPIATQRLTPVARASAEGRSAAALGRSARASAKPDVRPPSHP